MVVYRTCLKWWLPNTEVWTFSSHKEPSCISCGTWKKHLGFMGGAKRSGNEPSGTWGPWCNFVSVASTEILHFRRSAACRGWIAWLCIQILGVSKETKQCWCKTSQAFPSLSPCSAAFKNNSAAFKQSRATEKIRSQMHNYVDSLANKSTELCRWGGSGLAVE